MNHRLVYPAEDARRAEFVKRAEEAFRNNPMAVSYAENQEGKETEIGSGDWLALRWNRVTILFLQVDEAKEVLLYPLAENLPKSETSESF